MSELSSGKGMRRVVKAQVPVRTHISDYSEQELQLMSSEQRRQYFDLERLD